VLLLAAGSILRVLVAVAFRPALLFWGDSYQYLAGAQTLRPGSYRPSGYPLVVLAPLQRLHAVWLVPILQQLIGLGVGTLIYVLLRRRGVGAWPAALAAAPMLLDPYVADIEQFVLSETMFIALALGAFAALVWTRRPTLARAALAGFLIGCAVGTRTVGVVLVLPTAGFLIARRVGWRTAAAAAVAFLLPVGAYVGWYDAAHGQLAMSGHDGWFLYGRVATFAMCTEPLPSFERVLCDPRPPADRPSANFFIWSHRSPARRLRRALIRPRPRNRVLLDFSIRVIQHEPGAYVQTVAGDVVHYLAPWRFVGPKDEPLGMWQFHRTLPYERHVYASVPEGLSVRGRGRVTRQPVGALATGLRKFQDYVYTPGTALALALVLAVAGAVAERWRRVPPADRLGADALTLALAGFLVLLFPAMTAMFDYRYMLPALALLPPAGALGLTGLLRARRARSRPGG
jgi:4-amino-4-deoxy-L-arabinose transferase-like glycosyltransferase